MLTVKNLNLYNFKITYTFAQLYLDDFKVLVSSNAMQFPILTAMDRVRLYLILC